MINDIGEDVCPYCGRLMSQHYQYQNCERAARVIAKDRIFSSDEKRQAWYKIETEVVMEALKYYWDEHCNTVRSNFKKSFVPSVLEFYSQKGYISKKQLGIAKDIACNNTQWQSDEDWQRERWIEDQVFDRRKKMIDDEIPSIEKDPIIYQEKYKLANWLWREHKLQ